MATYMSFFMSIFMCKRQCSTAKLQGRKRGELTLFKGLVGSHAAASPQIILRKYRAHMHYFHYMLSNASLQVCPVVIKYKHIYIIDMCIHIHWYRLTQCIWCPFSFCVQFSGVLVVLTPWQPWGSQLSGLGRLRRRLLLGSGGGEGGSTSSTWVWWTSGSPGSPGVSKWLKPKNQSKNAAAKVETCVETWLNLEVKKGSLEWHEVWSLSCSFVTAAGGRIQASLDSPSIYT